MDVIRNRIEIGMVKASQVERIYSTDQAVKVARTEQERERKYNRTKRASSRVAIPRHKIEVAAMNGSRCRFRSHEIEVTMRE